MLDWHRGTLMERLLGHGVLVPSRFLDYAQMKRSVIAQVQ
jgi:hypothetical protein